MRYLIHLRWFVPLVLVSGVLWASLVSSAPLVRETNFVVRTPTIDVLLPASRAQAKPAGVALLAEPVYVDVTLPPRAQAAALELDVASTSGPLKLGVQRGVGFDILFPEATVLELGDIRRYTVRASEFSYLEPGYKLRFVVSAPGAASGSVVVKRGRVAIERGPLTWQWLLAALSGERL